MDDRLLIRMSKALLVASLFAAGLSSQAQSQGSGGLIGQVFCSDTQKPARFARVSLVADVSDANMATYQGRRGLSGSSMASTGVDGTFSMKDVPAGAYDVQVIMPGYIQPERQLSLFADGDFATRQIFMKMLTRVVIQAGQTASATVTAYRGADLSGSVSYDDGTPAAGLTVSPFVALVPSGSSTASTTTIATLRSVGNNVQTDDRGRFSLTGLADGTYTVQALPRSNGVFPVYLGSTIDRAKATMVTVKSGEEVSGLDMQIDLTNLHHIRGVLTGTDNHALANATVVLRLADNSGSMDTVTGIDGSFTFSTVPDGKFNVSSGVADPETHAVNTFVASVTVSGADINDVVLTPSL